MPLVTAQQFPIHYMYYMYIDWYVYIELGSATLVGNDTVVTAQQFPIHYMYYIYANIKTTAYTVW